MARGTVVRRVALSAAVIAATSAAVVLVPRTVGATWAGVHATLGALTAGDVGLLTILWLAGLAAHSFVLTASLPGLSTLRALTLNLTGSAVANVMPLGGAAGVSLNFAMARAWGFSPRSFRTFTAVSNLLSVLAKLVAGTTGIALVIAAGRSPNWPAAVLRSIVLAMVVVVPVVVAVVLSERLTRALGAGLDGAVAGVARVVRSRSRTDLRTSLPGLRSDTAEVVRDRWGRLTGAMASYLALQGALLWTCLHLLGVRPGIVVLVAALAVDRLLTMVPITPAGAGVVEAGTVAVLVALGADPVRATSAVLLYRAFTFLLEIPVGGAAIAVWLVHRRTVAVAAA